MKVNQSPSVRVDFLTIISAVFMLSGLFSYFILEGKLGEAIIYSFEGIGLRIIISVLPIVLAVIGVSIALLNYLKGGYTRASKLYVSPGPSGKEIAAEIKSLKNEIYQLKELASPLSSEEKERLVSRIEDVALSQMEGRVISRLESRLSIDAKTERSLALFKKQLEIMRYRFLEEIASLGRKGNLNLVIGIATTGAAVTILAATVVSDFSAMSADQMLSFYAPRISLSVFIEIFSFFFLRLYKSVQSEIKYFQNELTNAEFKFVALQKAAIFGNEDSTSTVIKELVGIERNFKLGKDESTVELEKARYDKETLSTVLDAVARMVGRNEK